jgi:hypothetical protein
LLAILAGKKGVKVHQMDVKTAFLESLLKDHSDYVEQFEGYKCPGKEDWDSTQESPLRTKTAAPSLVQFKRIAPVLAKFKHSGRL